MHPLVAAGAIFFTMQVYCDFSGYSDMAIGLAKIMGFSLSRNFAYPYFSGSIGEFWRRWHISLTSWFREYLYYPLGGNRTSTGRWIFNVIIVFLISGIWHGANWTFVAWGALHGLGYLTYAIYKKLAPNSHLPGPVGWFLTMGIVIPGWVLFRATDIGSAMHMLARIIQPADWMEQSSYVMLPGAAKMFAAIAFLLGVEWHARFQDHPLKFGGAPILWKQAAAVAIIFVIAFFGAETNPAFIYFQF